MTFQMESDPFQPWVSPDFERFYRSTLRRVVGSRLPATILAESYCAWARLEGVGPIDARTLSAYMMRAGHSRLRSNGMQYLDVAFAVHHPGLPDTLALASPRQRLGDVQADALMTRLDAMIGDLRRIRAALRRA